MTRHRDLEAELHPSVRAARDLRATADLWPQLRAALQPGSTPQSGGKRTRRDAAPLPIVAHVSDVLAEIGSWAHFWGRVLAEESDWTPPMDGLLTTPRLLRELALHVGFYTAHRDPAIGLAFVDECHEMKRKADATVYPSGARRIPLHFACLECDGSYTALLLPDQRWQSIPNLECDKDRRHSITPAEWQRLERRRLDPGAARAFLQRLRGVA